MRTYKKVIILVMSSSKKAYMDLENSIKETWFNLKNQDVEIIFYKDNENILDKKNQPIFDGINLILPINDGFHTQNQKTLLAFDWVNQNYDYDYIYRSNLGAFVNVENLLDFIKDKPKSKFYCGIIGEDSYYLGKPVKFASGSGYFLSRDLINLILNGVNKWAFSAIDDVALGYFLSQNNIFPSEDALRMNICGDKIFYQKGDKEVEHIEPQKLYHIRLRSEDRNLDIKNMKQIYSKLQEN